MLAGQLTIWDIREERDAGQELLHSIGDGPELGLTLLQPLFARGWRLHQTSAFASGRMLFMLANGVFEVKREGAKLGDVAIELFEEAVKLTGAAT